MSDHSSDMLKLLPSFMRNSTLIRNIFNAVGEQIDARADTIADLKQQLSIDTATWAIEIDERELGIVTDLRKTIEERRSVVRGKTRGVGKVDLRLIQLVAESYQNGRVDVQYGPRKYSFDTYRDDSINPPYPITIQFIDARGLPSNIEDLKGQIEEIKPCHIMVEFKFTYLARSKAGPPVRRQPQELPWPS